MAEHVQVATLSRAADDLATTELSAQIEPFDSFWEGPEHDVESGYGKFYQFYRVNYLKHLPADRHVRILVISCGPGYFVETLKRHGYEHVIGIDSFADKVAHGQKRDLDCRHARAFPFLVKHRRAFDAIVCEQELNHLTKDEMRLFLGLVRDNLVPGGTLIVHGPTAPTRSPARRRWRRASTISLRQALDHTGFARTRICPLTLYVIYSTTLNLWHGAWRRPQFKLPHLFRSTW